MAYESPIKITYQEGIPEFRTFHEQIADEIGERVECRIMASVQEQMKIEIDRNELIRALNYDRDQYDKGFADGYREGIRDKRNCCIGAEDNPEPAEWIETDHKGTPYLCPSCECFSNLRYHWCPWCGKDMRPEAIRQEEEKADEI